MRERQEDPYPSYEVSYGVGAHSFDGMRMSAGCGRRCVGLRRVGSCASGGGGRGGEGRSEGADRGLQGWIDWISWSMVCREAWFGDPIYFEWYANGDVRRLTAEAAGHIRLLPAQTPAPCCCIAAAIKLARNSAEDWTARVPRCSFALPRPPTLPAALAPRPVVVTPPLAPTSIPKLCCKL
jgi:hypothetical protein